MHGTFPPTSDTQTGQREDHSCSRQYLNILIYDSLGANFSIILWLYTHEGSPQFIEK